MRFEGDLRGEGDSECVAACRGRREGGSGPTRTDGRGPAGPFWAVVASLCFALPCFACLALLCFALLRLLALPCFALLYFASRRRRALPNPALKSLASDSSGIALRNHRETLFAADSAHWPCRSNSRPAAVSGPAAAPGPTPLLGRGPRRRDASGAAAAAMLGSRRRTGFRGRVPRRGTGFRGGGRGSEDGVPRRGTGFRGRGSEEEDGVPSELRRLKSSASRLRGQREREADPPGGAPRSATGF